MFNNKGPQAILAAPTFYSLSGTRLQLAPITVPATSYIDVDMHQLLAGVGDEFREGSLKISYQGISQQLGAQVKLVDPQNSLIWAEQLSYTTKYVSSRLENVWWLPYENSETRVVVSNTSRDIVSATITADGTSPRQSSPTIISLNPWETQVLDIMSDIVGYAKGDIHDRGGVSISHTGSPGSVIARMFISKASKGYSAAINFIDPEATASSRWHGNGLRLRNVNGAKLNPVLVARNNGTQNSKLQGKIYYTKPDALQGVVVISQRTIPANSTKVIDLESFIDNADVPSSVAFGGIELDYDTPKGTVITSVQSVSQNGNHVFPVPMFDPQNMPASAAGFPWKADGDFTTIVYVKNETAQPRKYVAYLKYDGGSYSLRESDIAPHQTIAIDFRVLRDSQTQGAFNAVIPLNLDKGQIGWSMIGNENKTLSTRSEQISLAQGVASTYSCFNCCPSSRIYDTVTPAFATTGVPGVMQYYTIGLITDCYGTSEPAQGGAAWTTSYSAVATITQGGYAEAVSPGETTITGDWINFSWLDAGGQCWYNEYPGQGSGAMEVVPRITGVSPTKGSVGGKIRIYITGTGFTATTEVVPITGIAFSSYDRSGIPTSMEVVFTIAGNASPGNNNVKVTAGGQTSNAVPIFIQIPKKARRDETANTVIVDPGPGNIVNAFGQIIATGRCGAYRNLKYTLTDQNDEALNLGLVDEEIGLTVAEVLSDIQLNPPGVPSPAAKTTLTNNVAQFGDILAAHQTPPCPPPFSIVLTQKFKVTVGQTFFDLSTANLIEITRSGPGQWTIVSTNQTP
jgi:hypothetical protein